MVESEAACDFRMCILDRNAGRASGHVETLLWGVVDNTAPLYIFYILRSKLNDMENVLLQRYRKGILELSLKDLIFKHHNANLQNGKKSLDTELSILYSIVHNHIYAVSSTGTKYQQTGLRFELLGNGDALRKPAIVGLLPIQRWRPYKTLQHKKTVGSGSTMAYT